MMEFLFWVGGCLFGFGATTLIKLKSNEQSYQEGFQAGIELIMPHLDKARETNHELYEVLKNVTSQNVIH